MDDADRVIASRSILTSSTLVPIGQVLVVVVALVGFYMAIDKRLTTVENTIARDRWSGSMQERWQTDFQAVNEYKLRTVDVRTIQEKLKNP